MSAVALQPAARGPLAGRVAVITGAGRGVGACTADLLVAHGMKVGLADLDGDLVTATATALGAAARGYSVDVTDPKAYAGFLDDVEHDLGPVDVFVNNAGIMPLVRVQDEPESTTYAIISVNLLAVISGSRDAVRRLLARRAPGHIVNISSAAGRIPIAGAATYTASKHAVSGFSNSLSIELRSEGHPIEVTAVHPAMIRTELSAGMKDNKLAKTIRPEDVAAGILGALHKPRQDVYVPASLGTTLRVSALIPPRMGAWLNRVTGGERAALDAIGSEERSAYEARVTPGTADKEIPA